VILPYWDSKVLRAVELAIALVTIIVALATPA
jgi:hypothetical protein